MPLVAGLMEAKPLLGAWLAALKQPQLTFASPRDEAAFVLFVSNNTRLSAARVRCVMVLVWGVSLLQLGDNFCRSPLARRVGTARARCSARRPRTPCLRFPAVHRMRRSAPATEETTTEAGACAAQEPAPPAAVCDPVRGIRRIHVHTPASGLVPVARQPGLTQVCGTARLRQRPRLHWNPLRRLRPCAPRCVGDRAAPLLPAYAVDGGYCERRRALQARSGVRAGA